MPELIFKFTLFEILRISCDFMNIFYNTLTGDRRKLHNKELLDPYSSPTLVRGDKIEKN
jgi:hypothetical protein